MSKTPKNKAAQEMARLRAEKLSPERRSEIASTAGKASVEARAKLLPKVRSEIARKAAQARWSRKTGKKTG